MLSNIVKIQLAVRVRSLTVQIVKYKFRIVIGKNVFIVAKKKNKSVYLTGLGLQFG